METKKKGRPFGTTKENNKKMYCFRLSEKEATAVKSLLAKMRGKLVMLFILFTLSLPVYGYTLTGGIEYTEETARQEAFEGVRPLSIVYSVGWENPKYHFDLNAKNDVLAVAKNSTSIRGIPLPFKFYTVIYKDEPNKEYIYSKNLGKYIVEATITWNTRETYPQKALKYDRYGHLLSIEFNTGIESFVYDVDGKLIAHWKDKNGYTIEHNMKLKQNLKYSAQ